MPVSSLRSNVANVLVIGTGAAGLRAAIAAHQAGSEVVVIGKRTRKDAHTVLAAGGINAALGTVDPEDSWQQHFADTLREGYFLADPRAVELLAREAPAAVLELAEWGAPFARTTDGRLDQRFFGTRRWRRSSSRRDENTGDGMYLALRAGCRLADMELVQFHPTGMVAPEEVAGTLVTEAVRGEGGHLTNALGERFMARYDPDRMELSARD